MERDADRILWGSIFRRNLLESEEGNLMSLLDKLGRVFIFEEGKDCRVWAASNDGVLFLVSLFFLVLSNIDNYQRRFDFLWKTKAPPRVLAFGWLALQGSILTSHYG